MPDLSSVYINQWPSSSTGLARCRIKSFITFSLFFQLKWLLPHNTTHGESCKQKQGEGRTSSKVRQQRKGRESYGGAKDFFLEGAVEYTVCEEFFTLFDST